MLFVTAMPIVLYQELGLCSSMCHSSTNSLIANNEILEQDCFVEIKCSVENTIFVMATCSYPFAIVANWIREPDLLLKKELSTPLCSADVYGHCPCGDWHSQLLKMRDILENPFCCKICSNSLP